jgi:predicted NodU family carbamoyl transferase
MPHKIIGVNFSHDASVCLIEDGILKKFYNEDRIQNTKYLEGNYANNNFISLNKYINEDIDMVGYTSWYKTYWKTNPEDIYKKLHKNFKCKSFYDKRKHHIYHAINGFYFSPFKEAMVIVVDAGGAEPTNYPYVEIESIFYINKDVCLTYYQNCTDIVNKPGTDRLISASNHIANYLINGVDYHFNSNSPGGLAFNKACLDIGLEWGEAGKLMGLSSYKYSNKKYNLNYDFVKIAAKTQEKNFEKTCELINKAIKYKNIKNVIFSGGVALNCVNNYKYLNVFKKINFFVDPNPGDSGTALGVALYCYKYGKNN